MLVNGVCDGCEQWLYVHWCSERFVNSVRERFVKGVRERLVMNGACTAARQCVRDVAHVRFGNSVCERMFVNIVWVTPRTKLPTIPVMLMEGRDQIIETTRDHVFQLNTYYMICVLLD